MRNLAFGTLLLFTGAAEAGTAKVVEYEQSETLYLTGDVDYNMVADVGLYLPTGKPNDYGLRVVLLNSPGGFVDAAFEISQIFDGLGVHTVIPNGASCMSSCASIIFNAGDYRTVAPEGVFGQHSCAVGDVPDDECNQVVGDHAFAHGVSHGAMSAFMIQVVPEDICGLGDQMSMAGASRAISVRSKAVPTSLSRCSGRSCKVSIRLLKPRGASISKTVASRRLCARCTITSPTCN